MTRLSYAAHAEGVRPLTRGSDPDWYQNHVNLAELYHWLRERGAEPGDPAYFIEKPWKWEAEWLAMCVDQDDEGARVLLEERAQ